MAYVVVMRGTGGELDRRVVETKEQLRAAMLEMVSEIYEFAPGDSISVVRAED